MSVELWGIRRDNCIPPKFSHPAYSQVSLKVPICRRKTIKTCQKHGWHHISREKQICCKGAITFIIVRWIFMSENPVISIGNNTIGNFTQVAKDFLMQFSQQIRHIDQQKDACLKVISMLAVLHYWKQSSFVREILPMWPHLHTTAKPLMNEAH